MSEAVVALDGELTIYRAAELKAEMLAAAALGSAPVFDLSDVSEIDTAGVQLLLLALREAEARGVKLTLASPSAAVREAFALLELESHLQAGEALAS